MNRRTFLFLATGAVLAHVVPKPAFARQSVRLVPKPFRVGRATSLGYETLVFGDVLSFYRDAPSPLTDGGKSPTTNEEFYTRKHAHDELFGFANHPVFLILHTDAGNDIISSVLSLEQRNVFCQFFVGSVNGEALSIQSSYLTQDKININGTVKANEINPFEANIQYWSSLNIEIEGSPNKVSVDHIGKAIYLVLTIMIAYKIPISRLVGHSEIPNNNKPDPGYNTLRTIRTQVYKMLFQMGFWELLDIHNPDELMNAFDIGKFWQRPATVNQQGVARCWIENGERFVDWEEISHLSNDSVVLYQLEVVDQPFEEAYLGFPAFVYWLRLPGKPLNGLSYLSYQPESTCVFVEKYSRLIAKGSLVGKSLPLTYGQMQNLATLFIETEAFENRGEALSEAIITFLYVKEVDDNAVSMIKQAYLSRFSESLP